MTELKSCPLCGNTCEVVEYAPCDHQVQCVTGDCFGGSYATEEEAINAWNRRAQT